MSDEYRKATCLHCGQRIEYAINSGADSAECLSCLFPVPLAQVVPDPNVTKTTPAKRSKVVIWTSAFFVVVLLVAVAIVARNKARPLQVRLAERAKEAHALWVKADAGDKKAKRELGTLYWNVPTNYSGSFFFDFKSPKVRSELLNDTSNWLSREKKDQIQTLFHKADAGDKDARGDLVVIVMGDIFRMQERMQLKDNATPEEKVKSKVHRNYSNGFDTTGTDYVAIGTNRDDSVGDKPEMRLERKSYRSEAAEYQAQFYLHGRAPIVVSEGKTVRIVVNDSHYTVRHDRSSNASTNSSGRSFESIHLVISPEIAYSFLSAQSGHVTFEGDRRSVSFPFTEESLAVFREFAQQCKREDDLVSKPVNGKP